MNISLLNLITGTVASLITIGAAIAGITIYLWSRRKEKPTGDTGPSLRLLIGITGGAVFTVLLIAVIISQVASATSAGQTTIHISAQSGNSAATATSSPVATANTVPTATAFATATSVPVPTNTPDPTYGNQTIAPAWKFDCGGCDQPILITVDLVATNASDVNMVWTLSLANHTADIYDYVYFDRLDLVDQADPNSYTHAASGSITHNNITINPGTTAQAQITFAFLPKHRESYTLTAGLEFIDENVGFGGKAGYIAYGPQTITFP